MVFDSLQVSFDLVEFSFEPFLDHVQLLVLVLDQVQKLLHIYLCLGVIC